MIMKVTRVVTASLMVLSGFALVLSIAMNPFANPDLFFVALGATLAAVWACVIVDALDK